MKYIKHPFTQTTLLLITIICVMISAFSNSEAPKGQSYTPSMAHNVSSRSLNTAYVISDQRQSIVSYNVLISVAATILLANSGQISLQRKPIGGSWTIIQQAQFTVGAGLSFNSSCTVSVFGVTDRGDSIKITNTNLAGTPVYSGASGLEILIN